MSIIDSIRGTMINFLFPETMSTERRAMLDRYGKLRDYLEGRHTRQIKVKPLQADDNIALNFCGLVIERSVSLLFGKPVKFDLPGEDDAPESEYISTIWAANKQGILLHKLGIIGSTYGTPYVKIVPDGMMHMGKPYPRLVALHPYCVSIETDDEDMEKVERYVLLYVIGEGKEQRARKEVIERIYASELKETGEIYQTNETSYWTVSNYIADKSTSGQWVLTSVVDWPYTFPPIVHWQNLPNAEGCYGKSDLEDVLAIQDRFNFIASNISKIIRYHAHPKTWARGLGVTQNASWGADEMIVAQTDSAMVENLEMQSDLESSRAFALDLRQALFDISHTVDMTSMADKLGALTNFGLRVLFMDALNKNDTKRQLYGDALTELNRRLLVLSGMDETVADAGKVVWQDALPVNEIEQTQALGADLQNGLVSKQTAAGARGYDWTQEEERMGSEQQAGDNVGAAILRAFGQGGGQNNPQGQ